MPEEASQDVESIRAAEVIAALCLATDLGMGLPFEHGLHRTQVAMRLADRLGADAATASDVYYGSLLTYCGCTTDASDTAEIFRGSLTAHLLPVLFGSGRDRFAAVLRALPDPEATAPGRAWQVVRRLRSAAQFHKPHLAAICEVGAMLSDRLGLPASVRTLFPVLTERWDGNGDLGRAREEELPLALRIGHVAMDAVVQHSLGGVELAVRVVGERAGGAFDPDIAACLVDDASAIFALDTADGSAWEPTLAWEPNPHLTLRGAAIDRALAAMGDFADLISPHLVGHSSGVAKLADAAAGLMRFDAADRRAVRRAAFVHDVGRVAVDASVWEQPGSLTADEREQVRLHPYHSERVLSRSPYLAGLTSIATAHHERLDGSGYHRGASGAALDRSARLLAAADAYHAMTERRPHRPPLEPAEAAKTLGRDASAGRIDAGAASAVIEAAGQPVPRIERPAGLTDREAEVVGLLARGTQTKQIARHLGISTKTADRHIQNAYAKIGVSTRAAATLFAMEHGLVASLELAATAQP